MMLPGMENSSEQEDIHSQPLAARMRPRNIDEIVGQEHLLGPGKPLRAAIERDSIPSIILWGPPGTGKTSLAMAIAETTSSNFVHLSAVSVGVPELRRVIESAIRLKRNLRKRTIVFLDEIHRFNKAQQDAVLPHVENGSITLIGATTENPSFEVNSALLSRCRVYVLNPLSEEHIKLILKRAIEDKERGLGSYALQVDDVALEFLADLANGDARIALTALEMAARVANDGHIDVDLIREVVQRKVLLYDKSGDQHYDLISALHKSIRDSDPDGSLYWLGRMLEAGEDPLYIARRLIRIATEDVGMADPNALVVAVAAQQAVHFVGMPEGNLALAEAVVYLCKAPKSNALYRAYEKVKEDIATTRNEPVPLHLRNAPTSLMKDLGYGRGYKYAHDFPNAKVDQEHLPESLRGRKYYTPDDSSSS